jgi:hypothetical protein
LRFTHKVRVEPGSTSGQVPVPLLCSSPNRKAAVIIEAIMPGVDFHVLRSEISMEQVLH